VSDELKPCPFCGQPASGGEWPYVPQSDNKQHGMVAVAQCFNRECPVQPYITLFSEGLTPDETGTWADVLLRWNTRPAEDALRAKWESARQTMTEIVEHGCVLHTEDGLCCYYCEADAEYPDESGDYEHFELPHTTTCIWAKARAMLAANAPKETAE